jgi:hypothetical protein
MRMMNIVSKIVRRLKRPFARDQSAELAGLRSELALVRSEIESIQAELLAQARSLEMYRDLVYAALQTRHPL